MSQYAPELPTTNELAGMYGLTTEAELEIALARERIDGILSRRAQGLVAIAGPCAMNDQVEIIASEGEEMRAMTTRHKGLYVAHRLPVWKPRSNPADWHGIETTDPEAAYATLSRQANQGTGTAIEIAQIPHVQRYSNLTVMDWFGGRNVANGAMMDAVALYDPSLPLAVKNGLDGEIDEALDHVERLGKLRGSEGATVVLLYRGGDNAKDPVAWEQQYRQALERTAGRMIVDVAHGSEMAHHPDGTFKKSAEGEALALEHVIALAAEGEIPAGVMIEASDADSPTDPHMPFAQAMSAVLRLHELVTIEPTATLASYDPWAKAMTGSVNSGHL